MKEELQEITQPSNGQMAEDRETQFPCPGCKEKYSGADLGSQLVRLSRVETPRGAFRQVTSGKVIAILSAVNSHTPALLLPRAALSYDPLQNFPDSNLPRPCN